MLLCAVLLHGALSPLDFSFAQESSAIDLKLRLLQVSAKLSTLEKLWNEQKLNLQTAKKLSEELSNEVERLNESLANSEASLTLSQTELQESRALSESLSTRLEQLSLDFQAYQRTMERRLWVWRIATVVATILALFGWT